MLIKKFYVPENELQDVGLKEINMSRLGNIVALAGKNGSGKSRFLKKLHFFVGARYGQLSQLDQSIAHLSDSKGLLELALNKNERNENTIEMYRQQIISQERQIDMTLNRVTAVEERKSFQSLYFVPKNLVFQDPSGTSIEGLSNTFHSFENPNTKLNAPFDFMQPYTMSKAIGYIYIVQTRWWNANHPKYSGTPADIEKANSNYDELFNLINLHLNTKISRDLNGSLLMFDRLIKDVEFSDGQKIILELCVALHAQKANLNNTVFILDEPENHLHPSAVIDFLENLQENAPNCQIWIATHSVPLLSYIASIDSNALWFADEGRVTHAGRRPELVLQGLLGDDDQISKLRDFTGLPAEFAALNFAAQSLLPPTVIADGSGDAQVEQISQILGSLAKDRPIAILDYGAGKGRLLQGMAAQLKDLNQTVDTKLDYFAYDENHENRDLCIGLINTFFTGQKTRYFNSHDEFFEEKDNASMDVVVMCNVLHEINPSAWPNLFNPGSLIMRALKDTGYLLVVEDQRIPVGEKAHEHGFFVLDTAHLRVLFSITEIDKTDKKFIVNDFRSDGRLKAHLIAKSLLSRITTESRTEAIEALNKTAADNILKIRKEAPTYLNGQLSGFWLQQYANTALYLR